MRVLYLLYHGHMGGVERHVHCLVKSLPPEIEPCICVFKDGGLASDAMVADGLRVVVLNGRNGHDWRILGRFARLMRDFNPDIVHIHSLPLLALLWVKTFSRAKVIKSLHLPVFHNWQNRILGLTNRMVDWFLPVSTATWQGFKQEYPFARGEVFSNFLRLRDIPAKDKLYVRRLLGLPDEVQVVGRVARMERYAKNWPLWLETMWMVLSNDSSVHAVAIGDGSEREMLAEQWRTLTASNKNARERLHWLGERDDAKEIIGGMDLYVMASSFEEMPTVLLEAFAMRTPVVGNLPKGGTQEVLARGDHVAELCENATAEQIAAMVKFALGHRVEMAEMAERAHTLVANHFDAELLCREKLSEIYRRVVAGTPEKIQSVKKVSVESLER